MDELNSSEKKFLSPRRERDQLVNETDGGVLDDDDDDERTNDFQCECD